MRRRPLRVSSVLRATTLHSCISRLDRHRRHRLCTRPWSNSNNSKGGACHRARLPWLSITCNDLPMECPRLDILDKCSRIHNNNNHRSINSSNKFPRRDSKDLLRLRVSCCHRHRRCYPVSSKLTTRIIRVQPRWAVGCTTMDMDLRRHNSSSSSSRCQSI